MNEAAATETTKKPVAAEKAKESAPQVEARVLREKLGRIVDELQKGETPMRRMGAALFASHIAADLGTEKATKLTAAAVHEYSASFRSRFPSAWGAACTSNVVAFVRFLVMSGQRDKGDGGSQDLIVEYQSAMSKLAS